MRVRQRLLVGSVGAVTASLLVASQVVSTGSSYAATEPAGAGKSEQVAVTTGAQPLVATSDLLYELPLLDATATDTAAAELDHTTKKATKKAKKQGLAHTQFATAAALVTPTSDVSDVEVTGSSPGKALIPASTMKIVTSVSALTWLGPDERFVTEVLLSDPDAKTPMVTLVGGGDPTLRSAAGQSGAGSSVIGIPEAPDLQTLAEETAVALAAQLGKKSKIKLTYDSTLFAGEKLRPEWGAGAVGRGEVSPVSALIVDGGRQDPAQNARVDDPAYAAARAFAGALEEAGVKISGAVQAGSAMVDAQQLAQVTSPPLSRIVEYLLDVSDNDASEMLARQAGAAMSDDVGTFENAIAAAEQALEQWQVPLNSVAAGEQLRDGSGLSRENRLSPDTLVRLLTVVATQGRDQLWPVASGLPVAGFTGTLRERYQQSHLEEASGVVRAKTGTLTGVNSLAGFTQTPSGELLAFAALANDTAEKDTAEDALDEYAATLGTCSCGAAE